MLNKFRIGTKLTAGFLLVVALLVVMAGVAWYALGESQRSTAAMMEVQDLLTDTLTYRRLLNTAQLQAVSGTLNRDTVWQENRKKTDAEINEIEVRVKDLFAGENKEIFPKLVAAYEQYRKNDDDWYAIEAKRAAAQKNMVETATKVIAAMQRALEVYQEHLDASKATVDEAEKVDSEIAGRMLRISGYIGDIQEVRRSFFFMMAEPKFEEQKKIGESTGNEVQKLGKNLDALLAEVTGPRRREALENATKAVGEWRVFLDENIKLLTDQELNSAAQDELSTTMTDYLSRLMENLRTRFGEIRDASVKTDALMNRIIMVVAVFAVIVGLCLSVVLSRNISVGVREVASGTKHIAETGDLSFEIPTQLLSRGDEVGDLAKSTSHVIGEFRKVAAMAKQLAEGNWQTQVHIRGDLDAMNQDLASMLDQVNHALREINDSVKQVATGAGEVSSASVTLSSGAQESAASLEEITASMSEISSQTKTNAENAANARDLAQKASKAAGEGQNAMQEMTGAMDRITTNSNEIQRVIKVIDDIAFQTNLLALNAAVEAARAGQHGKGFAVVAEEVRNLAARSAKAAQETSELIAKSGQEIDKGGEVASRTAEVLNVIVGQIKETTDLVAGIAVASNEQAQGVGQVTVGLQQIDAVTQQNTAAAEESASAANEMSGMATNLQNLVAKFKLR